MRQPTADIDARDDAAARPVAPAPAEVDVIVLSWNRVEETIDAIQSALAQRDVTLAVHVVDQGSASENLARLTAYVRQQPQVSLRSLPRNIGVPGGRNLATSMGQAPFVVAIDNDAEFASTDTVRRAIDLLRADPKLAGIGFRVLNYQTGEDDRTSWGYPERDWERRHLEFPAATFVGAGHALKRRAFEEAGGYDERLFFSGEELELGLKFLNLGYRVRYVGGIAIRHKVAPEARIEWRDGRYFFTVRNRIYLSLKSGAPLVRTLQQAAGFLLRSIRMGLFLTAVKGVVAGILMHIYRSQDPRQAELSRLKPDVARYVDQLNYRDAYDFWDRVRNAWRGGHCDRANSSDPSSSSERSPPPQP